MPGNRLHRHSSMAEQQLLHNSLAGAGPAALAAWCPAKHGMPPDIWNICEDERQYDGCNFH